MSPILERLAEIRSTGSRISKETYLRQGREMNSGQIWEAILMAAYHPLKQYKIKKLPWIGMGTTTLENSANEWTDLLDDLESGILSGNAAKKKVSEFIKALEPDHATLFKMILQKDLRGGFSAQTINNAFQFDFIPIFGVMRAEKWDKALKRPMLMAIKHDGLRGRFTNGYIYTRNGHIIKGIDHILDWLHSAGFKSLDGELMVPGQHFQDVSGDLRSHRAVPNATYNVFDNCQSGVPFKDRYDEMTSYDFDGGPVELIKHVWVKRVETIESTFIKSLEAGHEGLMLKDPEGFYVPKRSKLWLKVKAQDPEDVVIESLYEGKGKYVGSCGGFTFTRENGVEVRCGSGLSDELRAKMWAYPDDYIGLTAEVKYHEETPDGSLRHPVVKRFRWDK